MAFYLSPFTVDWGIEQVLVDAGTLDVLCNDLWTACRAAQASREGIGYEPIASGSGLKSLGAGVATGLTVELLGNWQLKFPEGNYIARVAAGNLVGGPGGDPIAYSAGVQTLLIQSANATVVDPNTVVPTAAQNAAATRAELAPELAKIHTIEHEAAGARTLNFATGVETLSRTGRTSLARTLYRDAAKTQPVAADTDPVLGTGELG